MGTRCQHCGFVELHSITCLVEAATQPHAMVDDDGGVFYPDGPEDAAWFAEMYGARPLDPQVFPWLL